MKQSAAAKRKQMHFFYFRSKDTQSDIIYLFKVSTNKLNSVHK